jgi:predicted acetyltransferase
MRLVAASLEAPPGLAEFLDAARADRWLFESDLPYLDQGLEHFLRRHVDFAAGKNLPEGWIPASTFWLLDNEDRAVAMSNLRHKLTPQLLNRGGHIGYYVMGQQRGKGYGTQVLALTLIQARSLGLDRVLVSADSDNERSIRIIERNRGLLEDERIDETTGSPYCRYWIDLTGP